MIPQSAFYCVVTHRVLNCDATGYRGPYRADPSVIAYTRGDLPLWEQFSAEDTYSDLSLARDEMELAKKHNIDCEIVMCRVIFPDIDQQDVPGTEEFLGYDVVQPFSSCYSAIVDRCRRLWVPLPSDVNPFATLILVAEYFNALLNPNKLFDDIAQAQRFLQVDRELASRFGGEMSCELAIVSVHLVR
jgi:hypothetical protein